MFSRIEHGGVYGHKSIYVYTCDHCTREFTPKKGRSGHKLTFCSRTCSHASQRDGIRRANTIKNLRDAHDSFCRRMDVTNVSQLDDVKQKTAMTNVERYGSHTYTGTDSWRSKTMSTIRERHGVDWFTQSDEFKRRSRSTTLLNHGVEYPMQSTDIVAKIDWKAAALKRHVTMKRNGSYNTSRREEHFHNVLLEIYGDVHRQVVINGWSIDFFIPQCDTFVQFDGVYWHGLDRNIDELMQFKSSRDRIILTTRQRDCEQVRWFCEECLKLVRVTDVEFSSMTRDELKAKLEKITTIT